ncbi:hypothetical protein NUW58_g7154 [Xylaria curta]|uniref:Uncharacterized protein n=1 Tax=Xylaria curta TaxID=42375 RepID=A0ACC1NL05_9PEZI|nr:hypothetical protein NUW58_g7154 [Xylaria curta]
MADRSTDPEDGIIDEDDYAVLDEEDETDQEGLGLRLRPEIIRDSQIPVIYRVEVEEGAPVPEDNSVEESGEPSHQELEYLDEEELPDGPECPPSPRSENLDYFEESLERIESLFNSRPKSPRPRRPSRSRPRNHNQTLLPKALHPETAPPPARPADYIHNLLDPVSSTPYPLGEFLDFILPILRCGIRILHLGCRDGGITFQLARAVQPNGLVVAVNCPGENTSCAAENNKTHQLPNVQFVELKDFTWLPWETDTFDIVYASNIMAYLPPAPQHEGARDKYVTPQNLQAQRGQEDWAENYARQLERGTVLREKWLDARVKEATIDLIRDMLCRWGDLAFSLWIGLFIGIVAQKKLESEDEDSDWE